MLIKIRAFCRGFVLIDLTHIPKSYHIHTGGTRVTETIKTKTDKNTN